MTAGKYTRNRLILWWLAFSGAAVIHLSYPAYSAEPPPSFLVQDISSLRILLGKPLLETVVAMNNESNLVLERLTPQGASFASIREKRTGENFDALRTRSVYAISFSTCSGAKDLTAKISGITAWEAFQVDRTSKETAFLATYLQRVLELINSPPSVSSPSALRSPHTTKFSGLVFEYVKGDLTETVSFVNEPEQSAENGQRISWQVANTSFCPKN